jgi:hypothetical protein
MSNLQITFEKNDIRVSARLDQGNVYPIQVENYRLGNASIELQVDQFEDLIDLLLELKRTMRALQNGE